jgi:hypothetical protein
VTWLHADVLDVVFDRAFDVWHDRTVFHFLTGADDRHAYVATLTKAMPVERHTTPSGVEQQFVYCVFTRRPRGS